MEAGDVIEVDSIEDARKDGSWYILDMHTTDQSFDMQIVKWNTFFRMWECLLINDGIEPEAYLIYPDGTLFSDTIDIN